MSSPPAIRGRLPMPSGRLDSRWEAVKKSRIPELKASSVRDANALANKHLNYKREGIDTWCGPQTAWRAREGDCEEFAIVKRSILLSSGWKEDEVYFILGNDLVRREAHALCIAKDRNEGWLVMDLPALSSCYPLEELRDFIPMAAYNGTGQWVYG